MATDVTPQFIFVGRPEFWTAAEPGAPSQFRELITARWELGRLSPNQTRQFVGQLLAVEGLSVQGVFDGSGIDAIIQRSEGSFGPEKLISVALIARRGAREDERRQR